MNVSERVNLAGVAIGDGLTDPETQVVSHAVNASLSSLVQKPSLKVHLVSGELFLAFLKVLGA